MTGLIRSPDGGPGHGLAFLRAGTTGPAIVLLHGFGSDRTSWRLNQGELARIGRTVAVDLPGHGDSGPDAGEGSLSALSETAEFFLDAETGPAHLIGHSLGGAIALDIAHRRPDLVSSLILISPAGLGRAIDPEFLSAFLAMSTPEEAETILKRLVRRPRLIGRQMASAVLAQVDRPGARASLGRIAGTVGSIRPDLADAVAGAAKLAIPKLVIWGAADLTNPIDETYLAELGADTVIVPETGHLPHMENAGTVNQAMMRFLGETLPSG